MYNRKERNWPFQSKEKLGRWRFCQFSFLIVGVGNNNEDALQKIVLLTNVGLSQQNVDTCLRVTLRGQTHHKRVDLLFESNLILAYCEHMKNQREEKNGSSTLHFQLFQKFTFFYLDYQLSVFKYWSTKNLESDQLMDYG